jgi:hypothetical protein
MIDPLPILDPAHCRQEDAAEEESLQSLVSARKPAERSASGSEGDA